MILKNKVALITGGSIGLGKEIAKKFINEGASLMLCARNKKELLKTQRELTRMCADNQKIFVQETDVSISKDIDRLVQAVLKKLKRVDILVNNAGSAGPIGYLEDNSWKEWVKTIEINLLGTVYLCKSLLPHFKNNKSGKIINLAGGGVPQPFPTLGAYATSKAAVVYFTENLAKEVEGFNIQVNSVAPGVLHTRLLDKILVAGPNMLGQERFKKISDQAQMTQKTYERAVSLCAFLASNQSDGITGRYISAAWDQWEKFPEYKQDLSQSDIFTVRRIVPEDRGKDWAKLT